ncbi:MerR family transcriptional regulator [Paenibacillus sp. GCM10027626]|uniref:MerR family transcriptional regulator n=1 Tax=Paenibacillus sp. GCM10027626 TaxID=3273411 RepID=UPI00363F872F
MMKTYYTIGEVAKITGATIKTIRYYDEINLLPASHISPNGYRYYNHEDIWQLELILFLRYLGFKIQDIKGMLHHELPVSTSIQWQIEAVQQQLEHLQQIQLILIQASQQGDQGTQLSYLHDIAEMLNKSQKQRENFIASKMQDVIVDQHLPEDWREQFLAAYIGFVPKEENLTAAQLAAWAEIKAMLNDPSFGHEIRKKLNPLWQAVQNQQIEASRWGRQYKQITDKILAFIEGEKNEKDPDMQAAVLEYVSLFQNQSSPLKPDKQLKAFLQNAEAMSSARLQKWWELVLTLNPSLTPYVHLQNMIKHTAEWLVDHPDYFTARGVSL